VLGGAGSLPKDRRSLPQLPPLRTLRNLAPRRPPKLFTEKIPPQRCRRDRGLRNPLCAAAALIEARRAKQLSSAFKECSASLDQRRGAP
jgi:hypothetical protein